MSRPQIDFEKVLADQGVPVTADGVAALLEADVVAANSIISNNSAMSPFWKLFTACVVTPVLWLIKTLLAKHVMPAMFVATATELYLELKAWEVGLERKLAVKTRGNISVTKTDLDAVIVIKAGTVIQTDKRLGAIYKLHVLADTRIPAGSQTAAILCEAEFTGVGHNLGAGQYCVLEEELSGIGSVSNAEDWITQAGAAAETDDALALRIRDQFASLGNYHIDAVYRSAIATFTGIGSDFIYFEHHAPRGPGTANAYVMLEVGETPQNMIDDINRYINEEGHHGHGDDMRVFAMPARDIDLQLDIWHQDNLNDGEIESLMLALESRIRAAFRESNAHPKISRTLPQSVLVLSVLSSELHAELSQLKSIRWHHDDLISALELPRINSLNIINRGVR